MPITSSAKKALRASDNKRGFNMAKKQAIVKITREFRKLVSFGKIKEAEGLIPSIQKIFDKAEKTNYLKKNASSRYKSRIMQVLNKAKAVKK